ncbi:subunit of TIM23 translocase complex [Puccinia graminis f. sp. tritici]|uniref:Subunit of TIM23 translocase complex n=1 Tax=Puccinia graminis f. sp. tritici TaxID=56615 RepID=A0A5B0PBV3_PUCGR|nr:subunit of TIM23 translocase complex [Puccinia graminis f. sp. tritici]KAA1099087.1 subunit of TIM23 translocase complex [Puccinia graminis f. sp. tritici]
MPVPISHDQAQQQSIIQKMGMGAAMGGAVGMTLGFLFGGFAIISRGAGPRGPLNTLATYMASSGGTFAFFMSIGSVIRTESQPSLTSAQLSSLQSHWRSRHLHPVEKSPIQRYH